MRLHIKIQDSNDDVEVDFIPEVTVSTPELYLLIYQFDTCRYIVTAGPEPDILTDNYSEFHLTKLHHVIHGYFMHDNEKIGAQVGCYVRRVGLLGFETVLLSQDSGKTPFINRTCHDLMDKASFMIIDLEHFNKIRSLIGQSKYTLLDYIGKRLSDVIADENGLTLNDETTLFSVFADKFDPSDIMNSDGMKKFLEGQVHDSLRGAMAPAPPVY